MMMTTRILMRKMPQMRMNMRTLMTARKVAAAAVIRLVSILKGKKRKRALLPTVMMKSRI